MKTMKRVEAALMKVVIRISDVAQLVQRFEKAPALAMQEVAEHIRTGMRDVLERVMQSEIELFLGQASERRNKRNGYSTRTFGIKGVGTVSLRVPRDRDGRFRSKVLAAHRRFDEATERDLAMLHLAGLSSRVLAQMSRSLLGIGVSAQEVSNALHTIVPAAKAYLERPLHSRRFVYLYVDGTNFHVRRTTVDKEPTLVVLGVDEKGRKSVLSMMSGDKESRHSWQVVFDELKVRGLDANAVELGIMDGLPGLEQAFTDAFVHAKAARCWVHKARNVMTRVPRRYQAAFTTDWNKVAYAENLSGAREAFASLKATWSKDAADAVECMERDIEALVVHYTFPKEHWNALRTTNPIERVNKEFKRRSKSMEVVSPDGLKALLSFTALRLEHGWGFVPIGANIHRNLQSKNNPLEGATATLLN